MTYTKQTWADNDLSKPVSAARMSVIENGIEAAHKLAATGGATSVADPAYGGRGDGVAPEDAAFAAAFAASTGKVVVPAGTWKISGTLAVPFNVTEIELAAGARVLQTTDSSIFTRTGTWATTAENLPFNINQGSRSCTVADATVYTIGSWVLLWGGDTVPGSPDKYAYLRRVTATTGTTLTFDGAMPRTISTTPRVTKITLAPPLAITGRGSVGYQTPATNVSAEAVHFLFTDRPVFTATVDGGGDDGVRVSHCVGGYFRGHVQNLLDDNVTHFGYGVNLSGSTRGFVVEGSATLVRHAVTTLAGPNLPNLGPVGEPENNVLAPYAYNCTNKGVDTHRVGWGNIIRPNVHGCISGGVQVRADATVVEGGVISGCSNSGINVDPTVTVAPTITSPTILFQRISGPAILIGADTILTNPRIYGFYDLAISVTAGASLYLTGGDINGIGAANTTALALAGTGSRIDGLRTRGCTVDVTNTGTNNQVVGLNDQRYTYSPNGTRYRVGVSDAGAVTATAAPV